MYVYIEHCCECHKHRISVRHQESKYVNHFNMIAEALILKWHGAVEVIGNAHGTPKLSSFRVYIHDGTAEYPLFDKAEMRRFPTPQEIINQLKQFMTIKSITKKNIHTVYHNKVKWNGQYLHEFPAVLSVDPNQNMHVEDDSPLMKSRFPAEDPYSEDRKFVKSKIAKAMHVESVIGKELFVDKEYHRHYYPPAINTIAYDEYLEMKKMDQSMNSSKVHVNESSRKKKDSRETKEGGKDQAFTTDVKSPQVESAPSESSPSSGKKVSAADQPISNGGLKPTPSQKKPPKDPNRHQSTLKAPVENSKANAVPLLHIQEFSDQDNHSSTVCDVVEEQLIVYKTELDETMAMLGPVISPFLNLPVVCVETKAESQSENFSTGLPENTDESEPIPYRSMRPFAEKLDSRRQNEDLATSFAPIENSLVSRNIYDVMDRVVPDVVKGVWSCCRSIKPEKPGCLLGYHQEYLLRCVNCGLIYREKNNSSRACLYHPRECNFLTYGGYWWPCCMGESQPADDGTLKNPSARECCGRAQNPCTGECCQRAQHPSAREGCQRAHHVPEIFPEYDINTNHSRCTLCGNWFLDEENGPTSCLHHTGCWDKFASIHHFNFIDSSPELSSSHRVDKQSEKLASFRPETSIKSSNQSLIPEKSAQIVACRPVPPKAQQIPAYPTKKLALAPPPKDPTTFVFKLPINPPNHDLVGLADNAGSIPPIPPLVYYIHPPTKYKPPSPLVCATLENPCDSMVEIPSWETPFQSPPMGSYPPRFLQPKFPPTYNPADQTTRMFSKVSRQFILLQFDMAKLPQKPKTEKKVPSNENASLQLFPLPVSYETPMEPILPKMIDSGVSIPCRGAQDYPMDTPRQSPSVPLIHMPFDPNPTTPPLDLNGSIQPNQSIGSTRPTDLPRPYSSLQPMRLRSEFDSSPDLHSDLGLDYSLGLVWTRDLDVICPSLPPPPPLPLEEPLPSSVPLLLPPKAVKSAPVLGKSIDIPPREKLDIFPDRNYYTICNEWCLGHQSKPDQDWVRNFPVRFHWDKPPEDIWESYLKTDNARWMPTPPDADHRIDCRTHVHHSTKSSTHNASHHSHRSKAKTASMNSTSARQKDQASRTPLASRRLDQSSSVIDPSDLPRSLLGGGSPSPQQTTTSYSNQSKRKDMQESIAITGKTRVDSVVRKYLNMSQ
eukprot:TRINITY_DN6126_c1_g1_i1.p1 TRINITY_DN6126_c1_g1~~TRINITY_DN6126_c1_g1_i1.p1  ORF type:complete len:1172 (-),score=181.03 TRINITY_DN6126_c1_g1_i1:356-3871(-)